MNLSHPVPSGQAHLYQKNKYKGFFVPRALALTANSTSFQRGTSLDFNQLMGVGSEQYCRYLWSHRIPKGEQPWRAIGHRQSGKATVQLKDFYLDASIGNDCSIDCYMSPNEFFDWRNVKQLAALHANWLEIDVTNTPGATKDKKRSLTAEEEAQVISEVFSQIADAGIPQPSSYVLSGSGGIHIYWVYEATSAFRTRVSTWRDIASKLVNGLKGGELWHVDLGASKDPARVLRMPGTKHGSTRRTVEAFMSGETYTFEGLANALDIKVSSPLKVVETDQKPIVAPKQTERIETKERKERTKGQVNNGKHTIGQWWAKIYWNVLSHTNKHRVIEGKRDSTAFILFVALRHMMDEEQALARIIDINKRLIGLDEETLLSYLKSARQTLYKFRKETIAAYLDKQLGMDVDWLYDNKVKLTVEQIKEAQHNAAIKTATNKAQSTLSRILNAVNELINTGSDCTQAAVAAICGRSERTVRRYWSEVGSNKDIRSASIYSPQSFCPVP